MQSSACSSPNMGALATVPSTLPINATDRHNEGLRAIFTTIRSASSTADAVRLGDKGDGTPSSKAGGQSPARTRHLNDGHIPDIMCTATRPPARPL